MKELYSFLIRFYSKLPFSIQSRVKSIALSSGFLQKLKDDGYISESSKVRRFKLLEHIDLSVQEGLEIGALSRPVVKKTGCDGRIFYVDFATTEQLRTKYKGDPNVNIDEIVETDYVWGKQTLPELLKGKVFDFVIASHVIEHVPNMLGWLQEVAAVLKDGGVLSLAIPDKRYSFDIKRNLTSMGELVESYLQDRRRPSVKSVFDHVALATKVDLHQAWSGKLDQSKLNHYGTFLDAFNTVEMDQYNDDYRDVHVNIFTPNSFLKILENACTLKLLDFSVVDFYKTQRGTLEFFVSLQKVPTNISLEEKQTLQLKSIQLAATKLIH